MINTKSQESLITLIKGSEVIGEVAKESFLELVPSLSQDQFEEMSTFFSDAEKEINSKKAEENKKKSLVLAKHLPEVEQAFIEAKKTIYKTKEDKSHQKENEKNEKLLNDLNNV